MQRVGFVGLGIMGNPMVRNLLSKGTDVLVNDIDMGAVKIVEACGGKPATLKEISLHCDIVFMILPNGAIVQDVLFGSDGIAPGLADGSLVVDMSSVTAEESRTCARLLADRGVQFLDAPVSGGESGAIEGTLVFMVGGEQAVFDKALPYFELMGKSAVLVGKSGAGSVTKLCNQIIVNIGIAAVAEALTLAAKADVDPRLVYRAIRGGLAGSAVLDQKAPKMITRDFTPGGKLSINHKDIKNVLQTARDLDVPLLLTSTLFEMMQALKVSGHMNDDHSGIVQFTESIAGVTVGKADICPGGVK